jgi:hypothetical protein
MEYTQHSMMANTSPPVNGTKPDTLNRNGNDSNDSTPRDFSTTDWRFAAMQRVLQNRAEDGSPLYLLFAEIQEHLPNHAALKFSENIPRVSEAFTKFLPDFRPRMTPAWQNDNDSQPRPVYGWWHGSDPTDNAEYELILSPDSYGEGDFVLIGPTKAQVEALTERVMEEATKNTCRCLRFTGGSWEDAPTMDSEIAGTGWDDIILAPALRSDIQATIAAFFTQKELFHRLGFAWRRGILLVGPPGTGKTMICKAAAHTHSDIPFLYVRDLSRNHRNGDALSTIFAKARRLAPCILAIEDMDGLIDRDNRSAFLNELDGFKNNDGLLIIASSNHP